MLNLPKAFKALLLIPLIQTGQAAVIATLNFNDVIWTVSTAVSGGSANLSTVSADGSTITGSEGSGGSNSGVRITVTLNSPISTIGFENVEISFTGTTMSDLEFDADMSMAVADTDGFLIQGDGVDINNTGVEGTAAETQLGMGSTFSSSSGSLSGDFTFDAAVDNSSISNLSFSVQINSSAEELALSNVQITGDVIPEPSSVMFILAGGLTCCLRRKRRQG